MKSTNTKVEHLMTNACASVPPSASLNEAADRMWKHDCGSLPVVDAQGGVVGMLTDRDVCMCAYHQGRSLKELRVADAMSRRLYTCSPDDDISTAQRVMREAQVRRLPVVDSRGRLNGLLTLAQIARASEGEQPAQQVSKTEVSETLAAICHPG